MRLIYFLPSDREPQPDIDVKLDGLIKDVQQYFANLMETQGFGRKTFQIETDAKGKVVVHRVRGKFTEAYYRTPHEPKAVEEIAEQFDTSKNIYLTILEISSKETCRGLGTLTGGFGGRAMIPASGTCFEPGITAHELQHAFGWLHDFRSYDKSSFCIAEWLDVHRAFNPPQPAVDEHTTVKMHPPSLAAPPNAIRLRFEVTDPDGLHQVQLLAPEIGNAGGVLNCKRLNGASRRTVEFVTTDLTPKIESVSLRAIDMHGNISQSGGFRIDITPLLPRPEVVSIPDTNLAAAVREQIGNRITTHTIANLTKLDVPNRGITDLTGLEHAHNLTDLNLGGEYVAGKGYVNSNAISNFSLLKGLSKLVYLNLSFSTLSDVSFLSGLTELSYLNLSYNAISDVSPLAELTQLYTLYLSFNAISDVSPLAELTQLRDLHLGSNTISDVSPLAGLTQLTRLELLLNAISDVSFLSGLTELSYLNLSYNAISDVSPLAGLTQLTRLELFWNAISDVSPLAGLTQLRYLNLGNNIISNVPPLAGLTRLTHLSLRNNTISDVSPLAGLTQLTRLDISFNAISNVSALAGLTQLTQLKLPGNAISDVSPLVTLNLVRRPWTAWVDREEIGLSLERNPLNYTSLHTHIPAMQAREIEVKFDPRTPTTFVKISGDMQRGIVDTTLPLPVVVEVRDQQNRAFAGVPVTFTITTGGGQFSTTTTSTDLKGRAAAHLTLGRSIGTTTVRVKAADISQPVQFTATAVLPSAPAAVSDPALRAEIMSALGKSREGVPTMADMLNLTTLITNNANIRDLTGLQQARNLTTLSLDDNDISNVAPLVGLPQLIKLSLNNNNISDVAPLATLTRLKILSLNNNNISDVSPLETLTHLQTLHLKGNPLRYPSLQMSIPTIQANGATVMVDLGTPTTLVKLSGARGVAGATFRIIIEVQDDEGFGIAGVPVTFSVIAGGGSLVGKDYITDGTGRVPVRLTLGATPGENTIQAVVPEMLRPVSFTIIGVDPSSPVTVRDTNLRAQIVETLSKQHNVQLTAGDMLTLTQLDAPSANIQDLTGLEHAHNLNGLNLGGKHISGEGNVNNNTISDYSPLFELAQLSYLNLSFSLLSDVSFLENLTQLKVLVLDNNSISDISTLANLTQLEVLRLSSNNISDISALANLTQLKQLNLYDNNISDISALANLTQLKQLALNSNNISDVSPLVLLNLTGAWSSVGLALPGNPLNYASLHTHIPAMQARGIEVIFDPRTYPALDIISGGGQQAAGGDTLANPFIVAAIDARGTPMRDVAVTFTVIEGGGELTTTTATTDARGRAETTLTLGPNPGRHSIRATAAALESWVTFTAIATAPAARLATDVNADGVVNIQDLVLVSSRLGQTGQNVADVNGDGAVNIQDLVLVAGELRTEAAAPSAWQRTSGRVPSRATVEQWLMQASRLSITDVRSQRGIRLLERLLAALAPKETALLANYPNPFNPETWIPYQLAKPAEVTLTIYAIDGRVVRQLTLGHQPGGMYHNKQRAAYWDGRNAQGEKVASGIYFYTLSAGDFSATRKLLIRK